MNWGSMYKSALGGARRAWSNPTARAGLIGAGVGGAYGAYSDNGSALGGAMKGALLGAGGYRYGGRMLGSGAMRRGWNSMAGALASGSYRGAAGYLGRGIMRGGRDALSLAYSDAMRGVHGAKMLANRPINAIRGLRRQAGFGFGGIG